MKFDIWRSSDLGDSVECPYEGAEEVFETKYRTKKIKDENGNPIFQEIPYKHRRWVIEVNSLEDIFKMVDSVQNKFGGGVIIFPNDDLDGYSIEIYDTWRE